MIITAWNNGEHHPTGAGYGLKIEVKDRDKYFKKECKNIILELQGKKESVTVNIDKTSFWNVTCGELINKRIGSWLRKNGKAPWQKGCPPKLKMEQIDNNTFKVEFI